MSLFSSVLAVTISGAFVCGVIWVLFGSIRPLLAQRYRMSESQVDWLLAAINLTLIPMMLLGGLLIDRFGVKNVFLGGAILSALAVFTLAITTTGQRGLGGVLLLGAGTAFLSTASIVLMPRAFYQDFPAAALNLGNVFFGLGALLAPALADWLIERHGYKRTVSLLALVCLIPALAALFTPRGVFPEHSDMRIGELAAILGQPVIWLAGLVLFFYVPVETAMGSWAHRYLTDLGYSNSRAAWLETGFWLTFLASRLAASMIEQTILVRQTALGAFIVILAVASAIAVGNLAGSNRRASAAMGLLLAGLFLGPIFPTLVGFLFERYPAERGTAYGAMFAVGAVGNLLLTPLIGLYTRRTSAQRSMRIPMILAVLSGLTALLLVLFPSGTS